MTGPHPDTDWLLHLADTPRCQRRPGGKRCERPALGRVTVAFPDGHRRVWVTCSECFTDRLLKRATTDRYTITWRPL